MDYQWLQVNLAGFKAEIVWLYSGTWSAVETAWRQEELTLLGLNCAMLSSSSFIVSESIPGYLVACSCGWHKHEPKPQNKTNQKLWKRAWQWMFFVPFLCFWDHLTSLQVIQLIWSSRECNSGLACFKSKKWYKIVIVKIRRISLHVYKKQCYLSL